MIGFVLLAGLLAASPGMRGSIEPTVAGLLRHLSLLFVPAAVGVVQQWRLLQSEALAIGVAFAGLALALALNGLITSILVPLMLMPWR